MNALLTLTGIKSQDFLVAMFFKAGLLKPFDVVEVYWGERERKREREREISNTHIYAHAYTHTHIPN